MKKSLIGAMLLVAAMTGTAAAAPNAIGTTGLINIPTAEVLDKGSFTASYYFMDGSDALGLNFGLSNNLELGLTHDNSVNYLNAKWKFANETGHSPSLAIGVQDFSEKVHRVPYLVASQQLQRDLRLHYGVAGGHVGIFGGVEKDLRNCTLLAEYDGNNLTIGSRFDLGRDVKATVGLVDMDEFIFGISIKR